jgi:hypothetical protein
MHPESMKITNVRRFSRCPGKCNPLWDDERITNSERFTIVTKCHAANRKDERGRV